LRNCWVEAKLGRPVKCDAQRTRTHIGTLRGRVSLSVALLGLVIACVPTSALSSQAGPEGCATLAHSLVTLRWIALEAIDEPGLGRAEG
jgi:hypothetical protein